MIGFVKLHRKLFEWEWYSDINVRISFIHLLLKANWKGSNYKGQFINRGSVVVGMHETPKEIGISTQQFRTVLKKLKNTQEITIKSTNKFTVVSIVNYEDYQDKEVKVTSTITNEQQTSNKQVTTSKECNNIKEDKKEILGKLLLSKIKISDVPLYEVDYYKIALMFQKLFIKNLKEKQSPFKAQENAKYKTYVTPIRLMIVKDEVTNEQFRIAYDYLNSAKGEFWKNNILSTSKLREQIQKLILQSKTINGNGRQEQIDRTKHAAAKLLDCSESEGL